MNTAICTAVAKNGRIQLIIRKGEQGYKAFSSVLVAIEKEAFLSWYGDVRTQDGKEQCGLIITSAPTKTTRR